MLKKNIKQYIALLFIFSYVSSASNHQHSHDHKNKRGLFTSDGMVYSEIVVTSTLPPVTLYSTSYWTSYWTSVITEYSTYIFSDYTSTKTLVTPTTYELVASTSFSTATTTSATSSSSTQTSTSIDASSLLNNINIDSSTTASTANISTLFTEVDSPYYMTTVSNGKTTVYYFEDVWYDNNGTATSTNYEKYIGTDSSIPFLETTFYSTSTTTVLKTTTVTTSTA